LVKTRGERGERSEVRRAKRRPPFAVLREEHEKRKIRPSSFVQDRGPVLGKDLRPEVRGERLEEREEHREYEIKREGERGENSRSLLSAANVSKSLSRSFSLTNNPQPTTDLKSTRPTASGPPRSSGD